MTVQTALIEVRGSVHYMFLIPTLERARYRAGKGRRLPLFVGPFFFRSLNRFPNSEPVRDGACVVREVPSRLSSFHLADRS